MFMLIYTTWLHFDHVIRRISRLIGNDGFGARAGHDFVLVLITLLQKPLDQDQGEGTGTEDQRQDHCPQNAG